MTQTAARIPSISVQEYKKMKDKGIDHQLIDVREEDEREFCNIGGDFIPMRTVLASLENIRKDVPVIVYCHHGNRSMMVVRTLQLQHGFTNLLNLSGGIDAWSMHIDPSIPQY